MSATIEANTVITKSCRVGSEATGGTIKATLGSTLLTSLVDPQMAARCIFKKEPFIPALVVFLMAALSAAAAQLLICRAAAGFQSSPAFVTWIFLVNIMTGAMVVVGGLCFISFFAMLLGGKVNPLGYIWSISLSFSPWMFSVLLGIIAVLIGGASGIAITIPGFTILFFWTFLILVSMLSVASDMDLLRSSLAVVMSFASAVLLFWAGSFTLFFGGMNFLVSISPPAG